MTPSPSQFEDDLEWSHKCEDAECWLEIYKQAFPTMQGMFSHRKDGQHQRNGIDRSITLENGKQILVDEKSRRRKDTGDIMLEWMSNDRTKSDGWVVKPLLADYIAYAFMESGDAYLMPVIQLQSAWAKNRENWVFRYGKKYAQNYGYRTISTPVPHSVLYQAMGQMLRVRFTPLEEHKRKQENILPIDFEQCFLNFQEAANG
jgi:hypothetical protein